MSVKNINITITDKRCIVEGTPVIVCGNSNYTVTFTFDEDWTGVTGIKARFTYVRNGKYKYKDVDVVDNVAEVPALYDIDVVKVGAYSGNLRTSTPARIPCEKSIACLSAESGDLDPGQYEQLRNDLMSHVYNQWRAAFTEVQAPLFTNVFDTVKIEYGKLLEEDGTVTDTTASVATTGYIAVKKGSIIRMADFALYNGGSSKVMLYDSNHEKVLRVNYKAIIPEGGQISQLGTDENGHTTAMQILTPSTAAYMKICTNSTIIGDNPILTIDEEIAYGPGKKLNLNTLVDYAQIINVPRKSCWSILPNERLNIAYSRIDTNYPYNTIGHFENAAANYGYNVLKCDVRPTSDGQLVCCHDAGFTLDKDTGLITDYDKDGTTEHNTVVIHNLTAAECLVLTHTRGGNPCLVGDFLDVCRTYGKVAFVTIRNEYMDVVIPKLIAELQAHNMTYSTIINCMTYVSLVQWRQQDNEVMLNYTLGRTTDEETGEFICEPIDKAAIDKAVGLGYCSLCGYGLDGDVSTPRNTCDFDYAREKGVRLLQAIAYKEGSPEECYKMGYDGCQIGYPWNR